MFPFASVVLVTSSKVSYADMIVGLVAAVVTVPSVFALVVVTEGACVATR
jgi:hypothetical protein